MSDGSPIRAYSLAWFGSVIIAMAGTGLDWALMPVEIPLIWLLILTFIPTQEIQQLLTRSIERCRRGVAKHPDRNENQ